MDSGQFKYFFIIFFFSHKMTTIIQNSIKLDIQVKTKIKKISVSYAQIHKKEKYENNNINKNENIKVIVSYKRHLTSLKNSFMYSIYIVNQSNSTGK